ncbi:unnamed protein product, partial [marine sediment metagenome]
DVQGGEEAVYVGPGCTLNWGDGNIDADPCFADPCNGDYHLKSQAGRWEPSGQTWVQDAVTSPCIDAGIDVGNPASDWTAELWPHGKRINMGAYGDTPEASMSVSDVGNIADLNNSGFIDYVDMRMFTDKWLYQEFLLSEDLNRDGTVDFVDFAIMSAHWLECTAPVNSNSIVKDGIEYYMQTDKFIYNLGEEVEMLYRVTNLRDEEVLIGCSRSPEFNLLVQKDEETIWMKVQGWYWFSPGITLSGGEYTDLSHGWDMKDGDGNLVEPGVYNVVGVMYNEPWNYDNSGSPTVTEVAVPITIIP